MSNERDKFLTEAMGWEEIPGDTIFCYNRKDNRLENLNLSTWDGFGKLWEWAIEQDWWAEDYGAGMLSDDRYDIGTVFINPDRFADAIYDFLKGALK